MTQPMPKPGAQDVTPFARFDFDRRLTEREKQGIETYGTTLQTFNGRDAIEDAQDEAIDQYQYLEQAKMEGAVKAAIMRELVEAGDALRRELWGHVPGGVKNTQRWLRAKEEALAVLGDG